MKRLCLALILLATGVTPANAQCSSVDYGTDKACSLTGVNGNCTIIIDRMRAATPPTIYVRRGSEVTLKVINPSPLEKLELDEISINTEIPIDSVQALAPLLTQLGQFALVLPEATETTPKGNEIALLDSQIMQELESPPPPPPTFDSIVKEQAELLQFIDASTKLETSTPDNPGPLMELGQALSILRVLLMPPLDGCNPASNWQVAERKFDVMVADLTAAQNEIQRLVGNPGSGTLGAGVKLDRAQSKFVDIQAHIDIFKSNLAAAQRDSDDNISELKTSIADLKKKIEEEQKKRRPDPTVTSGFQTQIQTQLQQIDSFKTAAAASSPVTLTQIDVLASKQGVLADKLTKAQTLVKTVLFPAEAKLQTLITEIKRPAVFAGPFTITDLLKKDKNDQQEVFTLNAVNDLTDPVKISIASATTDPYSQTLADSIVATAPTKTAVMQATVQYVTQPEVEVTAGVLVPFLPDKSYTAAPQSAGSATLVAQETHTFTILPAVDMNFRVGNDKFAGNKRYGWFGTVAVGYNPATTMVEFGVGPSLSLKSMVFSLLADVGRDTALASGFTTNQPLPGAATTPATNGVWSVKPSFGFSIRLPFNSSSGH